MAGETIVTVTGNLTGDPELRFTPSGAGVASFTVASTPRRFDKNSNAWVDGDPLFLRCNAWRQLGENIAESFRRGDRVIVTGSLKQRSFETREGEKRTVIELDVDEAGASVKFKTVTINAVERTQAQQSQRPAADPWDMPPPSAERPRAQQQEMGYSDEPPF